MLTIINGDLLQAKEDVICHQVNCQGKMNSGVAKSIRVAYPDVYHEYMTLYEEYMQAGMQKDLLGRVQGVEVGENKFVVNIFGQYNYGYDGGQYTNTNALYEGFRVIRKNAEIAGLSVAMPYMIGCYRGGADWKEVENLLLKAFDGYQVTLYKLHEG